MGKLLKFEPKNAVGVRGNMLVEVCRITPTIAASWLQQNTLNRPLSITHIRVLAKQMKDKKWMLNAETIKISDDESIMDGQHRLHACLESGVSFLSLVAYGVEKAAFVTIDTGKTRTGGDVLALNYPDAPKRLCTFVGTACRWIHVIERGVTSATAADKLANYEILDMAITRPEIWRCADKLRAYPAEQRLLSIPAGAACFYLMARKDWDMADAYMHDLYTGESLARDNVAYVLRGIFTRDRGRLAKLPPKVKVLMTIKGWAFLRSKKTKDKKPTSRNLSLRTDEATPTII